MNIKKIINFPSRLYNYITFKRKKVKFGKNLQVWGKLYIHGFGNIQIGDNVVINSSLDSNPTAGGYNSHFSTGDKGRIVIGNHVGISNCAMTAKEEIIIEDYVLIGSNCMITDTDFHSLDFDERMIDDGTGVLIKPVKIGKNAFIGARSIILKGVNIGKNSIVGAGSVVTKDIPENEIWAGNPARFIKKI